MLQSVNRGRTPRSADHAGNASLRGGPGQAVVGAFLCALTACGAGEYQAAMQTSADALRTAEPYLQTACDLAANPAADKGVVLRCQELTRTWDALFKAYERAHQCTGVPNALATGLDRFHAVFAGHGDATTGPATPVPDSAQTD